jgi:hypothetical protein
MGQKGEGNVFFDPMEINFGIIPTFEFRTSLLLYQFGLNHHCFHEIDQKDHTTVYWNKLYFSVCSNNMRIFSYWLNLTKEDGWTYKNRISWRFTWGYYVREFFGIIRESTINGVNKYVHDAIIDIRYAFYRRKSWIVNARFRTTIGYWKNLPNKPDDNGGYYRFDIGIENHFRRGEKGAMAFLMYTLDHLPKYQNIPRFSRDRLLQIGIRFYL